MTPSARILYAQDFFRFAYRVGSPISYGIRVDVSVPPALVVFGKHSLSAKELEMSADAFALCGTTLERLAYRLLAMELDSALAVKFKGDDRFEHKDNFVRDSACVVRLMRNSVAHNILDPVWKIDRKLRGRKFVIADLLEFDTKGLDGKGLNGKPLKRLDFGGPIALYRLSEKWLALMS
jgi:hypothetical protein